VIIVHISDFHVDLCVQTATGMVDTRERLQQAVARVNGLRPTPDVVLVTGDLVNDGTPEQYAFVKEALAALTMPCYVIPGNHDDRENMRRAFAGQGYFDQASAFLHYVVDGYPLRLVALDTLIPGQDQGKLCEQRLAWLQARLAGAPESPTLIYMHHAPFATGIPAGDMIGLRGAPAMAALTARHPQIEAIICGHIHRSLHTKWCGTVACTSASTSFQYPLDVSPSAAMEPLDEPPTGRLYVWDQRTGLVAHTFYVAGAAPLASLG
jgi:3',5'-cyclic AMP phosphodiesterase CpdA